MKLQIEKLTNYRKELKKNINKKLIIRKMPTTDILIIKQNDTKQYYCNFD